MRSATFAANASPRKDGYTIVASITSDCIMGKPATSIVRNISHGIQPTCFLNPCIETISHATRTTLGNRGVLSKLDAPITLISSPSSQIRNNDQTGMNRFAFQSLGGNARLSLNRNAHPCRLIRPHRLQCHRYKTLMGN